MEKIEINNWSKGLVSRIADDMISENAFADCKNVDLSDKYVPMSVKGKIKYNSVSFGDKPIKGMFIYHNKEAGPITVAACGGKLYYNVKYQDSWNKYKINGSDVIFDEDSNVEFVQYNDCLYMVNGMYPVIKNTGYEDGVMLQINKFSVNCFTRTNKYAWTLDGEIVYTNSAAPAVNDFIFKDFFGNRYSSNATVMAYNSSENKITVRGGSTYIRYTAGDVKNASFPRALKYLCIHKERIFGANAADDKNGLYWSNPYDPINWTPLYGLNYDSVNKDDGEEISGLASFGISVCVFKSHNVYRYLTDGDIDQWSSNRVDTTYGCISHRTIKLFEEALQYLSANGVVRFDGNSAVLVDEAVNNKFTKINMATGTVIDRAVIKNNMWNLGYSDACKIESDGRISARKKIDVDLVDDYSFCGSYLSRNPENRHLISTVAPNFSNERTADFTANGNNVLMFLGSGTSKNDAWIELPDLIQRTFSDSETISFDFSIYIDRISYERTRSSFNGRIRAALMRLDSEDTLFSNAVTVAVSNNYHNIVSSNSDYGGIYAGIKEQYISFNFTNITINTDKLYYVKLYYEGSWSSAVQYQIIIYGKPKSYQSYVYGRGSANFVYMSSDFSGYPDSTYTPRSAFKYRYWGMQFKIDVVVGDKLTYISKRFDTRFNDDTNNLTKLYRIFSYGYGGGNIKLTVASYDDESLDWDDISDTDKTIFDFSIKPEVVQQPVEINNLAAKRYLMFKIEVVEGAVNIYYFGIFLTGNYRYLSEVIYVDDNDIMQWGKAIVLSSGTGISCYVRVAYSAGDIENADWVRIFNNTDIDGLPLYKYIQFKIEWEPDSEAVLSRIGVEYKIWQTIVCPCACVWKTKYIINVPATENALYNTIEMIYDKNGYWTMKDNEKNFCYASSVNGLYAGSAVNGTIYKKDEGYTNAGEPYECMFVTKKFAMTDFENLFRNMKMRYKSSVPVTIGVSTDGREWKNYEVNSDENLIEVLKTFTGIVRGQTIQFRFSWKSNGNTEIHRFMCLWKPWRELNRG